MVNCLVSDSKCCVGCSEIKLLSAFTNDQTRPGGKTSKCKDCRRAQRRVWEKANPVKLKAYAKASHLRHKKKRNAESRAYRLKHPEKFEGGATRWRDNNHDKWRSSNLKKYGLTLDDRKALEDSQSSVCAICRKPETKICKRTGKPYDLATDHTHILGKKPSHEDVRGLLCTMCNHALGNMKDNPALLRAAALYLESPPAQRVLSTDRARTIIPFQKAA